MSKEPKRKRIEGSILASGEVTNHHHRVTVPVYEGLDSTREFDGATTVTHEEHKPITLPDKEWASGQIIETDHLSGMTAPVRD